MSFITITNSDSKRSKLIKSLLTKKGRVSAGCFIAEGLTLINELTPETKVVFFACTKTFLLKNPDFMFRENIDVYVFDDDHFRHLTDTVTSQGVAAVCQMSRNAPDDVLCGGRGIYLILEDVKDPGNMGTIIRTAEAFSVDAVFVTQESVDIYNPKVVRATMGSIFRVPIVTGLSIEQIAYPLKNSGIKIIGASPHSELEIGKAEMCTGTAIVLGNETSGISQNCKRLCDSFVKIPFNTSIESLNVSIAAGVLLYETFIARRRC